MSVGNSGVSAVAGEKYQVRFSQLCRWYYHGEDLSICSSGSPSNAGAERGGGDPLGQREEVQMSIPEQARNDKWDLWTVPAGIKAVPFQSASNETSSVWSKMVVLVLHAVKYVGSLSLVIPNDLNQAPWVLRTGFLSFIVRRSCLWTLPRVPFHLTRVFIMCRWISAGNVKSKHARRVQRHLSKDVLFPNEGWIRRCAGKV